MNLSRNPPDDALTALLASARSHLANNELREAALLLNQAQTHNANDPRIFLLAGQLAEKSGKRGDALDALEHAAQLAPQWWPARLELALLLARGRQYQRASQEADKVFQLAPNELYALSHLVDIARYCGDLDKSISLLRHGLTLRPDDRPLLGFLARDLAAVGQIEQALQTWGRLIALNPQHPQARFGRLKTLVEQGRAGEGLEDAQVLLQQAPDDAIYRHYAQLAEGNTPAAQPPELVKWLFDEGLAGQYDLHMVRVLGYQLPRQVAGQIAGIFPDKKLNLLDLGCGTGLLGLYLGPVQGSLVGVDLSAAMTRQAARHQVYDRLDNQGILEALGNAPEAHYDVIAALDVLPYVGDLAQFFPAAQRALASGGFLIFSTEAARPEADAQGRGYLLQANGRYAHRRDYLESLLAQAGFAYVKLAEQTIRSERDEPVRGFVVTAQKLA